MSQARRKSPFLCGYFRVCLHGGGGPQIGEVTRGGSLHLSCKRDKINMRDYMDRRVTSPTWGPPPPCKQSLSQRVLERIPFIARLPVTWCCILRHRPVTPSPQPILIHFDYLSWRSAWILSGRPRAQAPTDPNNNQRSRFGWSRHWAVTSFFLTLIRRRRKTTLLFEKSKESLSVDMVHLYLYQHITSHKWHISHINRPIPDASGATLRWRPIILFIKRFTITFTANC